MKESCSDEELIEGMDASHRLACHAQRELFRLIARADRVEAWRDAGARDMAHWLWMRYGISDWKARRWIASAHALEGLPLISEAFRSGVLGIDKVVELTRFATPETEGKLISWADEVSCGAIRHKGNLMIRRENEETVDAERSRYLNWWYSDDGMRWWMEGELPAHQGAAVAKALDRLASEIPLVPGEQSMWGRGARRADALVALCSARIASDPDPDRATVIVHSQLGSFMGEDGGCEIEGGPAISPATARRLACNGRIQTVVEDETGQVGHLGRMTREPPAWMLRQLKYRDQECRFPSCGSRRFTQAHHIKWWDRGGTTDLENLVLICSFHHRLVHEYGWGLRRDPGGAVRWFLPDGTPYRAGPGPPREPPPRPSLDEQEREPLLASAGV